MLNINLLVLPLHWKFTSTQAQLGRENEAPWKRQDYISLIALLHVPRSWQVPRANRRPKGSCFLGPARSLSPALLQSSPAQAPECKQQGTGELPAALPPNWHGEHGSSSLAVGKDSRVEQEQVSNARVALC